MAIRPPRVSIPGSEKPSERYGAVAASLLFHFILLFVLMWNRPLVESDFLEGELGGGGGGNNGLETTLISLAGPPEAPPVPVDAPVIPEPDPTTIPTPDPVPPPPKDTVKTPPAPTPAPPTPAPVPSTSSGTSGAAGDAGAGSAGSGGGAGGGTGGGVGTGTGTGTGSGSGDGTGGGGNSPDGLIPPSPTAVIMQPPPPKNVRGRKVVVLIAVDATGRVTDAELKQSSGNSKYDAELKKTAFQWRFRPARNRQGEAVKSTMEVMFGGG